MNDVTRRPMPALGKMLLVLYIFSSPFYLWDSGLPQISDFILLLLICWAASQIASQKLSQHGGSTSFIAEPHFTLLTLFVYYATIVNLFWALISPEKTSFITYTVYLLFNFATMFAFASLYLHYKEDLLKLLYWSLTISLWVQTILTAVSTGTQGLRTTAFFNNPNQLGYYALLTAAILSILHALGRGHPIIQNLSLFACLFISAASLSRATIVGTGLILMSSLIFQGRGLRLRFNLQIGRIILATIAAVVLGLLLRPQLDTLSQMWDTRLETDKIVSEESLDDRGYQRIHENPQYWILGAGEGEYHRFETSIELHSLIGNIFFSYGVVGASLFVGAILLIIWRNPASIFAYAGVFLYGLAHNGIRDGYLWVLIGLTAAAVVMFRSETPRPANYKISSTRNRG